MAVWQGGGGGESASDSRTCLASRWFSCHVEIREEAVGAAGAAQARPLEVSGSIGGLRAPAAL